MFMVDAECKIEMLLDRINNARSGAMGRERIKVRDGWMHDKMSDG